MNYWSFGRMEGRMDGRMEEWKELKDQEKR